MASIHAAMLTCPDTATLQVRVTLLGCSDGLDRYNFAFDPAGGGRHISAPLVLSLDGYAADDIEYGVCHRRSGSFDESFAF
jgi:hypothetical protein